MFEVFNTNDARTVTFLETTDERVALGYATALGGAYDFAEAEAGSYVVRQSFAPERRTVMVRYDFPYQAKRRADFENMTTDSHSFSVLEYVPVWAGRDVDARVKARKDAGAVPPFKDG